FFTSVVMFVCFFFFSSRRRHTRSKRDWSSDVCSSDLEVMHTSIWAVGASLVGALVAWLVDLVLTNTIITPGQNPGFLIRLVITGPVFVIATGVVMARSKLPEVLTVGSALSRVPGIGRFFSGRQADEEPGSAAERMAPTPLGPAEAAREAAVANSLLPPLPPLSAGRVRGP